MTGVRPRCWDYSEIVRRIFRSRTSSFTWCSQIRITRHPRRRRRRKFRWSRARLARSFSRQKSVSLCSHWGRRHPCQKRPSIKIATRSAETMMSGRPGRVREWHLYRTPIARNSCCTRRSSGPCFSITAFIARDRCSDVMWSAIRSFNTSLGEKLLDSTLDIFTHGFQPRLRLIRE